MRIFLTKNTRRAKENCSYWSQEPVKKRGMWKIEANGIWQSQDGKLLVIAAPTVFGRITHPTPRISWNSRWPKSKRSTVDIPYSLCWECVRFLKKPENYLVMTSGEKDRMLNWRNIWPSFMWDLLSSPKNLGEDPEKRWRMICASMIWGPVSYFPAFFPSHAQIRLCEKPKKKLPTTDGPRHHFPCSQFLHLMLPYPPTKQFVKCGARVGGAKTLKLLHF